MVEVLNLHWQISQQNGRIDVDFLWVILLLGCVSYLEENLRPLGLTVHICIYLVSAELLAAEAAKLTTVPRLSRRPWETRRVVQKWVEDRLHQF